MRTPGTLPCATALVLTLLAPLVPALAATEEETDPAATEDAPAESGLRESVTVSADLEGIVLGPRGASTTVVEPAKTDGMPSTLSQVVKELPGVAENGQGGLFQVVSIRGVSRHRVTSMISGVRMTTERRAGVSLSFLDPLLMGSVQVLRGPATSFFGSGALGGVMQVGPRSFSAPHVELGYATGGDERSELFGTGGENWSAGLAHREASNAETPDGTVLDSHFNQYSAFVQRTWARGGWEYELLALPSYGERIGKASTDYPERVTEYPREQHGLLEFAVGAPAGWRLRAYVHAQDLETDVYEPDVSSSRVTNESLDLGLRWEREKRLRHGVTLTCGAESFNRRGVDALERIEDLDPVEPEEPQTLHTLDDARLDEFGAFGAAGWRWGATRWQAGGRYSMARQRNAGAPARDLSAWNGFAEVIWSAGEPLELRGALDSGLRFPSLSELFYTGTTGRGGVVGNPDLQSERSLNAEVSLRWLGRRLFASGLVFRNRIDDYIERIEIEEDLLTWVNLVSGTIRGAELQAVYVAGERWRVLGSAHFLRGRDSEGEPLADVPPREVRLGVRREAGPWRVEGRVGYRDDKTDPGSGEKSIDAARLLSASLSYAFSPAWRIFVGGNNLLDEEYFPAADRKAPLAPGRAFSLRLAWSGPRPNEGTRNRLDKGIDR